jgi:peptidoglycan/xylan/chitin deacetylase (PgdA/CDA1 family)
VRHTQQIAGSRALAGHDDVVAVTPPPGRTAQGSRTPLGRAQLRVRWDRISVLCALLAVLVMVIMHAVVVAVRDDPAAVAPKPAPSQTPDQAASPQPQCPPPTTAIIRAAPAAQDEAAAPLRTVALTFDDGPGRSTPAVLDILRQAQVQATFFVVGKKVAAEPEMLRQVHAEGHALGNHTWSHKIPRAASGWSPATLASEIERTRRAVVDAAGLKPCLFRPPGGIVKGAAKVSRAAGLSMILWSVDTRDWAGPPTGKKNFATVIRKRAATGLAEEHPVILLHDGGGDRAATIAALPGIIEDYRAHGYRFVTLDKMT